MIFDHTTIEPYLDYTEGMLRVVEGNNCVVYIFVEKSSGKAHVLNIAEN
ncbi:hypothetical protein B16_000795